MFCKSVNGRGPHLAQRRRTLLPSMTKFWKDLSSLTVGYRREGLRSEVLIIAPQKGHEESFPWPAMDPSRTRTQDNPPVIAVRGKDEDYHVLPTTFYKRRALYRGFSMI